MTGPNETVRSVDREGEGACERQVSSAADLTITDGTGSEQTDQKRKKHARNRRSSPSGNSQNGNGSSHRSKRGPKRNPHQNRSAGEKRKANGQPVYAALDLGTNNCRLLVARPTRRGFLVIDAFSRIIRLGEGVARSGQLSEAAMERTIDALQVCSRKMQRRAVKRSRLIATQACRVAENADEFIERVREETGLDLEIINQETEARLAVSGCASLLEADSTGALVFDIGGGSSELIWLDLRGAKLSGRTGFKDRLEAQSNISCWTSLPVGVVTIAEKFGGHHVTPEIFEQMVAYVMDMLHDFEARNGIAEQLANGKAYLLGTSGTVTTLAGIYLGLPYYDRRKVDGCWLNAVDVRDVSRVLVKMSYEKRAAQPCIGTERADLVLGGCAILEAMMRMWPSDRLRVADRGLREGILATLMAEDDVHQGRTRNRRGGR